MVKLRAPTGHRRRRWRATAMTGTSLKQQHRAVKTRVAPIDERQLSDVDGPALLKLLAALPPKHPSRPVVRDRTIQTWLPLAYSLAARFNGHREAHEDLAQIATLGLI